ncbi:uncharacterized protein LOC135468917 [Liolophura sinensis]|uniref:uncharacterized protein LOC135468917 n=1 Tax=Liolophura sinensis TaxID=3198878 RepID=UPI0031596B1F
MSLFALARISFAILLSSLGTSSLAEPTVLKSFSEIVAYASSGAPILISVDIDHCTHDFPPNLQPYSFTERLDFFILTDVGISSNRETTVNGTRLKLVGPATRVLAMNLDPSGSANFRISDVDPSTGQVVTSGTIVCRIGSGLTPTAGASPGVPLINFTDVLDTLQAGYRVYVAGELSRCKQPGHREGDQGHLLVYGKLWVS